MPNQFILTPYFLDQPSPELEALAQPGWVINKPVLPSGDLQHRLPALHRPISDFVARTIASGQRPVSLAGDCCTALGVLAGLQHGGYNPGLIWFDAHGDFNTPATSPSGFLGGMPLAMLVGRGDQTLMKALGIRPLPETKVILSDARDLDPKEREALAGSKVHHFAKPQALLDHPLVTQPLYIHFDVDLIDPAEAPAMSYLAPGGPSLAELQALFHALAASGHVLAVSLAAWNPKLDGDGRSQAASLALLQTLISQ
jgi:arginase